MTRKSPMSKRKSIFVGTSLRGIPDQAGRFGEDVAQSLFGGEKIVTHEEQRFADLGIPELGMAIEVKACNGQHGVRITPKKCSLLHTEVTDGFVYTTGVVSGVFYGGVYPDGKSKVFSRKMTETDRRRVYTEDLEDVFTLDVDLMIHLLNNHKYLLRDGGNVQSIGKSGRELVIELGRRFLRGFLSRNSPQKDILRSLYGHNGWTVHSTAIRLQFNDTTGNFHREIPFHYIGSRGTGRKIKSLIANPHAPIQLDFNNKLLPVPIE